MNKTLKITIVALFAFSLIGCMGVKQTKESKMVRQIQADWKNKCKFIGIEEVQNGVGLLSQTTLETQRI